MCLLVLRMSLGKLGHIQEFILQKPSCKLTSCAMLHLTRLLFRLRCGLMQDATPLGKSADSSAVLAELTGCCAAWTLVVLELPRVPSACATRPALPLGAQRTDFVGRCAAIDCMLPLPEFNAGFQTRLCVTSL